MLDASLESEQSTTVLQSLTEALLLEINKFVKNDEGDTGKIESLVHSFMIVD